MVVQAQREPPQCTKGLLLVAPGRLNVPRANPKQSLEGVSCHGKVLACGRRSVPGPGRCWWGKGIKSQEERGEGGKEIKKVRI